MVVIGGSGYTPAMDRRPAFRLRPARKDEFGFAETIYIDAMRPLMAALGPWDEAERRAALRRSFKAAEVNIITLDGADIGWMQVSERDTDYNLAQIQLLAEHCGKGIGTQLIRDLLERARRNRKTVSLSAVRTNRAIKLYERLGFRIIDPDATPIIDMVWKPEMSPRHEPDCDQSLPPPRAFIPRAFMPRAFMPRAFMPRAFMPRAFIPRASMPSEPPPSAASSRTSSNIPVSTSMRIV